MHNSASIAVGLGLALLFGACTGAPAADCSTDPTLCPLPVDPCADTDGICYGPLRINEAMSKNDGAWVDAAGETDDWLELVNVGDERLSLLGYSIGDSRSSFHPLPAISLAPGQVVLLWADDTLTQGAFHLPFRLSSRGEIVRLWSPDGRLADRVTLPASAPNDAFARYPDGEGDLVRCRFATPARPNGDSCEPPPPPELPAVVDFADYSWPSPWPPPPAPLVLSELALRPAAFVEVINTSQTTLDLSNYRVTISAHAAGLPWPGPTQGVELSWPVPNAAPGERLVIPVDAAAVADIAATQSYEGVVTVWEQTTGAPVDRVDFMAWPDGAVLARPQDSYGPLGFCTPATAGNVNAGCDPLPDRPIPDSLRHVYTPGDFEALAIGGTSLGMAAVKFIVDMDAGDAVHLLSSAAWSLHYTYVRERIELQPHLDRCDPTDATAFYQGWAQFSQEQYFQVDTRRYLLGTLVHYQGSDLRTVEFVTGDRISPAQIERAFFAVTAQLQDATPWFLRPQGNALIDKMRAIEGRVPILDPNAPFRGVTLQLLTEGVAYGVLQFVPADALHDTPLGPQVVVVTDQVPGDIPLVGGLITEAFQTPLSHVNVLSRSRGTPNMALRDARTDTRIASLLDTLVRFEITPTGFAIEAADPVEAQAYWESLGGGDPLYASLDTTVRGVQMLVDHSLADLPALGAKAAQLAELARVQSARAMCPGPVTSPRDAAAIPVVHSLEHYDQSGAAALLQEFETDPLFASDPRFRADKLALVRAAIMAHPVEPALLAEVESYVGLTFGAARIRLRSSSNVEDLPGFNGAGLYTSLSGALYDPDRRLDDGIRTVWASLFNARAYDERTYYNVDPSTVAMGVLMHLRFQGERANAVGISRNILDPIRSDIYYFNAQVGEAGVVNPAPGVTTEQLIYRWGRTPRVSYYSQSSLPGGTPVLRDSEIDIAACTLRAIHDHFRPLLDPLGENRWFAMDIELKLLGPTRSLLVKQARPYTFGQADRPTDCREF